MEYRKFGDTYIVRIDRDEEVLTQLKVFAEREQVKLASITGLGAVKDFTVGVFDPSAKVYQSNRFQGVYEIVSLVGTINTMDGAFYCHVHMCAADQQGRAFGGHLNEATVSATCEMVIQIIDGKVDRYFDEEIGLNLFRF